MRNSRLVNLLKKLDSTEKIRLEEMVYSPFFNKDKKCIELFELLKSYGPTYDSEDLDRQQVFKCLFPEKEKMTSSLNTTMSKLLHLMNELFLRQELEERAYGRSK